MRRLLTLIFIVYATSVSAQQLTANFVRWNVYKNDAGECYMAGAPTRSSGNFTKRDEPYVLVVQRGNTNEINISSGYPYAEKTDIKVTVDGQAHALLTDGETAFAKTAEADNKLTIAMKKGTTLIVRGTSQKGTKSEDHYALAGFTAAFNQMHKDCP